MPKKCPNINNDIIIVTGCNFKFLLWTSGVNITLSNAWTTTTLIIVTIPVGIPCVNPTITAGAAPIHGPIYGITFVTPQNNANNTGAFRPDIEKPIVFPSHTNVVVNYKPCT